MGVSRVLADSLHALSDRGAGVPLRELALVGLTAAIITYFATGLVRVLATRIGAVAYPRERDVHVRPTPRMGGLAMFVGVIAAGRFLLRPLFTRIATLGSRETFTAASLLVVIGTTVLMDAVGLSPSLGAFLAGVVLADSEFRHELEADLEPFKGLLLGVFFMAVGMSTNMGLLVTVPGQAFGLAALLLLIKTAVVLAIGIATGESRSSARKLAIALSQGGEFAFVLLTAAYVPRNALRLRLRHPMVLGVKAWALAHLLSNGSLADLLLFGSFLVWAVLSFRAARQRDRQASPAVVSTSALATGLTLVVGIGAWVVFALWLHGPLMGVRPFG